MNGDSAKVRAEWNYTAMLVSLLIAMVLQSILLPCLCYAGTVNGCIAGAVDLCVVLRLIVARMRRERGKAWVFYALLPFLIVPVLLLGQHFWVLR